MARAPASSVLTRAALPRVSASLTPHRLRDARLASSLPGLSLLQRGRPDELLRACFRAYDMDSSGFLEREELSRLITRVYRFVLAEGDMDGAAEAAGAAAAVTAEAFAKFDANRDERLSFEEFQAIVQSDYLLTSWFQLQATAALELEESS